MAVTGDAGGRPSAAQIRGHLRAKVNDALRRPGMYGGEMALHLLLDALAFAEGRHEEWRRANDGLRERGRFTSVGVRGVFLPVLPKAVNHDDAVSSVYAELAHRLGWLETDRLLTAEEYDDLTATLPGWVAEDRGLTDVLARFGRPSIRLGGGNPRFPYTLLYVAAGSDQVVSFHLWGDWAEPLADEPTLLAARRGDLAFTTGLHATPEGARRRPTE
ncbi:hypothetical protein [Micromonospora sp. DT47]|uniref:hypothetical protein n=1 Tax=Micromonospora sp. DT47 TaxID=3393431 RepID=UPI003CE97D92